MGCVYSTHRRTASTQDIRQPVFAPGIIEAPFRPPSCLELEPVTRIINTSPPQTRPQPPLQPPALKPFLRAFPDEILFKVCQQLYDMDDIRSILCFQRASSDTMEIARLFLYRDVHIRRRNHWKRLFNAFDGTSPFDEKAGKRTIRCMQSILVFRLDVPPELGFASRISRATTMASQLGNHGLLYRVNHLYLTHNSFPIITTPETTADASTTSWQIFEQMSPSYLTINLTGLTRQYHLHRDIPTTKFRLVAKWVQDLGIKWTSSLKSVTIIGITLQLCCELTLPGIKNIIHVQKPSDRGPVACSRFTREIAQSLVSALIAIDGRDQTTFHIYGVDAYLCLLYRPIVRNLCRQHQQHHLLMEYQRRIPKITIEGMLDDSIDTACRKASIIGTTSIQRPVELVEKMRANGDFHIDGIQQLEPCARCEELAEQEDN